MEIFANWLQKNMECKDNIDCFLLVCELNRDSLLDLNKQFLHEVIIGLQCIGFDSEHMYRNFGPKKVTKYWSDPVVFDKIIEKYDLENKLASGVLLKLLRITVTYPYLDIIIQ